MMNDESFIEVQVLLFAGLRDALKRDQIEVVVARTGSTSGATVADLIEALAAQFPAIAAWLPHTRVAVNCEYATPETLICEGDEIALIPPVAGG